jgi:hypothetical protein
MQDLSTWQNVALLAAPALAALAGGASWYSAMQTRRIARAATLPDLVIQVLIDTSTKVVRASIHNAGSGAARGLLYVIARDGQVAFGYANDGILRADEKIFVHTTIKTTGTSGPHETAMVVCRDRYGYPHSWTTLEKHVVHKTRIRRRPKYSRDPLALFARFFPDSDPEKLKRVDATASPPSR